MTARCEATTDLHPIRCDKAARHGGIHFAETPSGVTGWMIWTADDLKEPGSRLAERQQEQLVAELRERDAQVRRAGGAQVGDGGGK